MPQPSRFVTARLSIRRGSKDSWESENTVLLEGEPGWDFDTRRLKIGDGVTPWNDLAFYSTGDSEAPGTLVHDDTVLPEHIDSVTSAVEYFGAKFKVYEDNGVNEFIAGLQGTAPRYVLTLASGTGGSASHDGDDNIFSQGDLINLTATPFSGYEFDSWQGVGSEPYTNKLSATTAITIQGDQYVRANFKLITP
jgi:hypothetical protein